MFPFDDVIVSPRGSGPLFIKQTDILPARSREVSKPRNSGLNLESHGLISKELDSVDMYMIPNRLCFVSVTSTQISLPRLVL